MFTKRYIVEQAFEEIGLGAYAFDLQPQQMEGALRRLDNMMALWNGKGIRLGYPLPSSPADSDLDQATGVPDAALQAMIASLAVMIAPSYGKTVSPDTKMAARAGYKALAARAAMPAEMQFDSGAVPSGAGNKPRRTDPFLSPPSDRLSTGPDSFLDLE